MWTTLFLTLAILALTICSSTVALYKMATRPCSTCSMLRSLLAEEKELSRQLLGLGNPTPPTSPPRTSATSPEPEREPLSELEGLSPEIQEALLREYREHLASVPRPRTINPEVEQIVPGQTIPLS